MAHIADRWHKTVDGSKVPTERYGKGKRWQAVWIDPATRREVTRSFATRAQAEKHIVGIESSKTRGEYIAPGLAQVTLAEWAEQWLAGKARIEPSTRAGYRSVLDVHVLPKWGRAALADIRHEDIQSWVTDLEESGHKPRTVIKAHGVLSQVLRYAVKARRLSWNAAKDIELPRVTPRETRYLTMGQLSSFADAASPVWDVATRQPIGPGRLIVLTLGLTGIRWGELAALKVSRVDLLRRRMHIAVKVVEVDGVLVWGLPKNHERRWVPIPSFLVDELAVHLDGKGPDDLVFPSPKGEVLRNNNVRRSWFNAAVAISGIPDSFHPHELRHTAASLAVSAGAKVKAVQRMLGHKTATMTLDVYADLFDDDLDAVAERLDVIGRAAHSPTDQSRTKAKIVDLETRRAGR